MARTALSCGLEVGAYMSQAAFLLAAGLSELLQEHSVEDAARWLPVANAVQKLTSPAEMGELFKVLLLTRQVTVPGELRLQDRSHRL